MAIKKIKQLAGEKEKLTESKDEARSEAEALRAQLAELTAEAATASPAPQAPPTPGTPSRSAADSAKIAALERSLSKSEQEVTTLHEKIEEITKAAAKNSGGGGGGSGVVVAANGDGGAALEATQRELEETREKLAAVEAEFAAAGAGVGGEGGAEAADGTSTAGEKQNQEKLLGAKVIKLQKLLRRAEQMLAEKKKGAKEMGEQAEKDSATITGLQTKLSQMAARGGTAQTADLASAVVHTRCSVEGPTF